MALQQSSYDLLLVFANGVSQDNIAMAKRALGDAGHDSGEGLEGQTVLGVRKVNPQMVQRVRNVAEVVNSNPDLSALFWDYMMPVIKVACANQPGEQMIRAESVLVVGPR